MQLVLGALAVYDLSTSDHTPVEEVNILWALEGGLAHTGPQWCALHLPHILLADLRRKFSRRPLCGVSRRRWWRWKVSSVNWGPPRGETVTRSCEWWLSGCLAGWRTTTMDAQWFEYGRAHGSLWTLQVVKAVVKCSSEMQNDLCGKRLDGYFLEWCDTPLIRRLGFSTTDGCWFFDEIEGTSVPWCLTDNNVYFSIPHPAGGRVLAANKDRVLEFLRTTFFDNAAALECQLAAICLTLRGVSIVRAFITVGPGGVGQSLNACLVANHFGGSHGFMDMSVFFSEDELRKQADTFTGKVNVGGVTYSPPRTRRVSLSCFFSAESGPPCVPQVVITGQEAQHRQTAPRGPLQEGDERGPGGRPSPVRHLDEDGHFYELEEVRDERDSQVPRGHGNDVPVGCERSLIVNCKERIVRAQRLASFSLGNLASRRRT